MEECETHPKFPSAGDAESAHSLLTASPGLLERRAFDDEGKLGFGWSVFVSRKQEMGIEILHPTRPIHRICFAQSRCAALATPPQCTRAGPCLPLHLLTPPNAWRILVRGSALPVAQENPGRNKGKARYCGLCKH